MNVLQSLEEKIKVALKARNQVELDAVRLIKSTVKNKEIELLHPLSEAEFFAVLSTMAKQRRESMEQFKAANRTDLFQKEEGELKIIESFLPKALTDQEVLSLIQEAIKTSSAKGPQDMGAVMKELKEKTSGRVDGKVLAGLVKEALSKIS